MTISRMDAERFVEVFVDICAYGKTTSCTSEYFDEAIKAIDDETFECWMHYLRTIAENDPDNFDEWYDNMTFDSLDPKQLVQYHLPTEKITVAVGNEDRFLSAMHKILVDWFESCTVTKKDMAIINIQFSNELIYAGYDILTGCDVTISKQIKESFETALNKVRKEVDLFNEMQGSHGVNIECAHTARSTDVSTRAYTDVNGKVISSINARDLAISWDDLFYPYNKKLADREYITKFFNTIKDTREKGMPDPGHIGYDEFFELTGKKKPVTT